MGKTSIEWADATFNPIKARSVETGKTGHYCVKVNAACNGCYAESYQQWRGNGARYAAQDRQLVELYLDVKAMTEPLRTRISQTWFVCSMTDLFLPEHRDEWIFDIFGMMMRANHQRFMVLTKRPARMRELLPHIWNGAPARNVAVGVTCHDQDSADAFLPVLAECKAWRRFVSYEPALGLVDWGRHIAGLDLIIAGGMSGRDAIPSHPRWFRQARDQCAAAGVPFMFKQWGNWVPNIGEPNRHAHIWDDGTWSHAVPHKSMAGRSLDGQTHDGAINWGLGWQ